MTRLVFVDVDDTLLTPPYAAVRRVAKFLGKKFPPPEAFLQRSHVDYHKAFPGLFRSSAEMWAIVLISLPFGHFKSQEAMALDIERMTHLLGDHRLYLISKNPPSFTRWRVRRLREIFNVNLGDRYIACGPILKKGDSKLSIIEQIAHDRDVPLTQCLLIDDSIENLTEVAQAGVRCAVIKSSWNQADIEPLKEICPHVRAIESAGIPDTIKEHLSHIDASDEPPYFLVPPLTPIRVLQLAWIFLKRRWLYGEALPALENIVPIARNPLTSYLYAGPHTAVCDRLLPIAVSPTALSRVRVLPLGRKSRPMLLPVSLQDELSGLEPAQKVRALRASSRNLMLSKGQKFVRASRFFFTDLSRTDERARILSSSRIAQAKAKYMAKEHATQEAADALAVRHVEELLTSRTYLALSFNEWVLDILLNKIFKKMHLKTHPAIKKLEQNHFIFYAASHRSYLDSAVLWMLLSHNSQSSPYVVAADKMRTVWIGRLGAKMGAFFLRRSFVDDIYAATIGEIIGRMQRPSASLEVFLEGQRSRSGLTLPPKKGILSVVWENMKPESKVAIVPVSFAYNKIPESEKLIKERFDERKKLGTASLREISDMEIKRQHRKPLLERMRAFSRRIKSQLVSESFVQFGEPIIMDKSSGDKAALQGYIDETMLRINGATAVLPSSILCLLLLGTEDKHVTRDEAVAFLQFSYDMVGLYKMPSHLYPRPDAQPLNQEVQVFIELPFVNRKFKRSGVLEKSIICINELDLDHASFYKNNVLHFFVLPGILSHVLAEMNHGHIEELHRCFDHMFAKLQKTYFLPQAESARAFIDGFIGLLIQRDLVVITDQQWRINERKASNTLLRVLAGLGGDIIQGDLPHLMDSIRRSSRRKDVNVPCQLTALRTATQVPAQAASVTEDALVVTCAAAGRLGEQVDFKPDGVGLTISGVISRIEDGSVAIAHHTANIDAFAQQIAAGMAEALMGSLVFKKELVGEGVITNLSPDGAFVSSALTLAQGDGLNCAVGEGPNAFTLQGRVTRVTPMGVGIRFEHLSEQTEAQISMLSLAAAMAAAQTPGKDFSRSAAMDLAGHAATASQPLASGESI